MEIEDIKIGEKVELLGKHGFYDKYDNIEDWYNEYLSNTNVQKIKKQGFAYVRGINRGEIVVSDVNNTDGEWLFLPQDLEPYYKIGDLVRVKDIKIGITKSKDEKCPTFFNSLKKFIEKEHKIVDFTQSGNIVLSCGYVLKEEWLEKVKEEKKLLLPIGTEIKQVKPHFGIEHDVVCHDKYKVKKADKTHIFVTNNNTALSITKQEFEEYWEVVKED